MSVMGILNYLQNSEYHFGDFLLPWGMIVGAAGFLIAWLISVVMERTGLTRHVWHLPLFFVALCVLCGCVLGLLITP